MLKQIKKGDVILLLCFLALAAGIAASPIWTAGVSAAGNNNSSASQSGHSNSSHSSTDASSDDAVQRSTEILVAGENCGTYSLQEDQTITIDNQYGRNVITIQDGTVSVTESDCRNQICVQHVSIDKAGEWIVCLPHRLTIQIIDNESASGNSAGSGSGYDAIVH